MAKNIFRDFEVKKLNGDMVLELAKTFEPETTTEVVEAVPEEVPVEEAVEAGRDDVFFKI